MLKKILGEAPFDVTVNGEIRVSPQKGSKMNLEFVNDSEYDMPLSCSVAVQFFIKVDKSRFDIILPAEGKTSSEIAFSVSPDSKIFGGRSVCEIEISDRIFDSKTVYEAETVCEMSFKCCDKVSDAFTACGELLFSHDGVIFGNKGEFVSLEILCTRQTEVILGIPDGAVKDCFDGQRLVLTEGLNKIVFEFIGDGGILFLDPSSEEKTYLTTLSPKYFI